jgi:hypothetical protein
MEKRRATVSAVLSMIARREWTEVEPLLDPEVHWTTAVEEHLHGPREVIEYLARDPPPGPPAFHELKEGRIVRWIDKSG